MPWTVLEVSGEARGQRSAGKDVDWDGARAVAEGLGTVAAAVAIA